MDCLSFNATNPVRTINESKMGKGTKIGLINNKMGAATKAPPKPKLP